jgi:hypothetical protein
MKITEPYSPRPRAKASVKPVRAAGTSRGRRMLRKMRQRPAPRLAAASSSSGPRSASTGWTERTTNGSPMNVKATHTPSEV